MKVPPPSPEQGGLSNRQLGQRRRQQNSRAEKMKMAAAAAVGAQKLETAVEKKVGRNVGNTDALAGKGGNGQAGEAGGGEMGRGGMLGFCLWKVVCGPILMSCYIIAAVRIVLISVMPIPSVCSRVPLCLKILRVPSDSWQLCILLEFVQYLRFSMTTAQKEDMTVIGDDIEGEVRRCEEEEEEEEEGEVRSTCRASLMHLPSTRR